MVGVIHGLGPVVSSYFIGMLRQYILLKENKASIFPLSVDTKKIINAINHDASIEFMLENDFDVEKDSSLDYVFMPCNTTHEIVRNLENKFHCHVINIVDETVDFIKKNIANDSQILLLGTKSLIRSGVYQNKLQDKNITFLTPNNEEINIINDFIFEKLVYAPFLYENYQKINSIIKSIKFRHDITYVLLACTELALIDSIYGRVNVNVINTLDIYLNSAKKILDK